jgi:phosphonatase-like hydrolase
VWVALIIFDIAGTLIEDHDEVATAFLTALRQNGIAADEREIGEWRGGSKREIIGHFVTRQFGSCRIGPMIEQTYANFRYLLEKSYAGGGVVPIQGAHNTLAWLRERKIKIATTTGFYREVRDMIFRAAGWQHTFDTDVCSDDVAHGRPAPDMIHRAMRMTGVTDPAAVVNVGDTPLDLQSAAAAGVKSSLGVLTGKHSEERLRREPYWRLLGSVAEIPQLLSASPDVSRRESA